MAKFVCQVCGYVYEGDSAPEFCPVCKAPASKFSKQEETLTWAAEHVVGVAKGVSEDILADLRANFQGELRGKSKFELPSISMLVPKYGTYVLVMSHPNCQPEVRRIIYSEK